MSAQENPPAGNRGVIEEFVGSEVHDTGSTRDDKPQQASAIPAGGARTQNDIIAQATADYIAGLDVDDPPPPRQIERELLAATNFAFGLQNASRKGDNKISLLKTLTFSQVAQLMIHLHRVVAVAPSGKNSDPDYDLLAVYCPSGDDEGIYLTSDRDLRKVARAYNREITINLANEVFAVLREEAPRVHRCSDRDLIAVNNGIFNYATKQLEPFTPEHVFLSKSSVDYDPAAISPVIDTPDGDTWEVEEWMASLSDDPEIVELLWEVCGAVVRPHVRWNKSAWLYADRGNNGKGSLVELMRNLCGPSAHTSIPLTEMGKDFMLEPLTRASAIIVDENDVGQYIDKAANLKAIITNDVIMINRKHKYPISYQFWGFMVQCLNEFPRVKDKSDSFYRRQLFIPFEKCFTGVERRYIKDDYLSRPDVLRYVLKRILHMDYYVLSEPEATQQVLREYKDYNDPIRNFWGDHRDLFKWDLLPFPFLYDMFRSWFPRTNPSGSAVGRNVFINDLRRIVTDDPEWAVAENSVASKGRMDDPEHLIATYEMRSWYNPAYTAPKSGPPDLDRLCTPVLNPSYRGLVRVAPLAGPGGDDE